MIEPINKRAIPIYKATFVDPSGGTGIVMSVPAHAPLDYLALRDLVGSEKADKMLISIIKTDNFGKYPAKEMVERLGVKNQDDPKAETATKTVYSKEAHNGKMTIEKYRDIPVSKAKDLVRAELIKSENALPIYIIANSPVFCRCGAKIVVNIVKNQWFINYGDEKLKEKARDQIEQMSILPEKTRAEYIRTIDWLKEKACTRARGLGTHFPFDKTQMIEALSDSTIYMGFYTLSPFLRNVNPEKLTSEFFDYVLLGKGKPPENAELKQIAEKARESFTYWYPVDSRHSAFDLIRNHLPFYVMNHIAVYPKKYWPKQIVTNGFVLMDGTKMSKSFGNILPIRDALKEYGADVVRMAVVSGADLTQDTDFNRSVADGIRLRLRYIMGLAKETSSKETSKDDHIQRWLLSLLDRRIKTAEVYFDGVNIRSLSLELFYSVYTDLQWYKTRTDKPVPGQFFEKWLIVLSPLIPHVTEELWEQLGFSRKGLVVEQLYPEISIVEDVDRLNAGEQLLRQTITDIKKIMDIVASKQERAMTDRTDKLLPKSISLFVSSQWKYVLYDVVKERKSIGAIMAEAKEKTELKAHLKDIPKVAKSWIKNPYGLGNLVLNSEAEFTSLRDAIDFLSNTFECRVNVLKESDSDEPKAKQALPNKPSILIEI